MSGVRISGLVALANDVQRDLARPLTASQLEQLHAHVREALKTVDSILAMHDAAPADLPQPTGRISAGQCRGHG